MEYQVSARKWRPQTFEEVIGQEHVARTLMNAIQHGKVAHAYLFSGIRGVGKTTLARILAKGLNCAGASSPLAQEKKDQTPGAGVRPCNRCDSCREITEGRSVDVIEIDGASNTGVDDVRELRENVKYLPLRGKYKVYIIDEIHMLSTNAFNALLKTLEEPPPHLVFIFATTESHKIPSTILSRCQHFTFRRISRHEMMARLRRVAEERQVHFSERGLILIAKAAEGSMRDALSLLDQAISYGGESITEEDLFVLLGRVGEEKFHTLARAIHQKDAMTILGLAKEIADQGYDLRQFLSDWMEHLRHLIVAQQVEGAEAWIDLPAEEISEIRSEAALFSQDDLQRLFFLFSRLQGEIRSAPHPHLLFEVALLKAVAFTDLQPIEKILARLEALGEGSPQKGVTTRAPKQSVDDLRGMVSGGAEHLLQKPSEPSERSLPSSKEGAIWEKLLLEIKEQRPNLGSYLEQGTLLEIGARKVKIGYAEKDAFLIPLILKEENKKWLATLFKAHFQRELALEAVALQETKPPSSPLRQKEKDGGKPHPFVQEALQVFGGEVIEIKRV
ncbi:MAG TPA: DNA polymerase III subunit gamma/tau, partial [Candidatus Manganitrophaceae bacterium]|nr:DNA polymerase III subunit gamma/tau [Candidatus Manganitrophaceae bacterium]